MLENKGETYISKFVIECPECGRYAEAKTGFFARKKIDCACGHVIDLRTETLSSRVCPHCGTKKPEAGTGWTCPDCGQQGITTMRSLQSKVCQLAGQCEHPELKKLAEEIRYSDPVSSKATTGAEADLRDLIDQLQQAVTRKDTNGIDILCGKAKAALNERNRLCKLNK